MRDLYNNIAVVHLLDAQDINATDTKSKILDLADFDGAAVAVNVGACGDPDTGKSVLPVLQASDTTADADFEAVEAAEILGGFSLIDAAAEDQVTQVAGYVGSKRYLRVLLDCTGAIGAVPVSVDGILGYPGKAPAVGPDPVTAT